MADWENRSSRQSTFRGVPGGISPSEEQRLKMVGRQKAYTGGAPPTTAYPVYRQQYPAITNQFRDLIRDPRSGQMHEMTQGPYAGPVISPGQWMSQHPMMQLGNLFARALAWPSMAHPEYGYSDPYQAPPGVNRR